MIRIHFSRNTIVGDSGSAGHQYVGLVGYVLEPDVEEAGGGSKRQK